MPRFRKRLFLKHLPWSSSLLEVQFGAFHHDITTLRKFGETAAHPGYTEKYIVDPLHCIAFTMTLTYTLSWDPPNHPSWVILCWANICRIIQVQMYCKCIHISHHTSSGVTVLKAIIGRSVPPSTYKLSGIIQPITHQPSPPINSGETQAATFHISSDHLTPYYHQWRNIK